MAVPLCMKRMARERPTLEKPNDDYFVWFENDNLRSFHAYVMGPKDTLYEHKFVKLHFEIPDRYPLVPPKCKFIQHTGGRIHPNLYVEGKVCLSILGTWQGEPWALAMTIETVLITVRSLLDNHPYEHEPSQRDDPEYNRYVQYGTWRWLLLDYLRHETNPQARAFIERYTLQNATKIRADLQRQSLAIGHKRQLTSPYERWSRKSASRRLETNYPLLTKDVDDALDKCCVAEVGKQGELAQTADEGDLAIIEKDQPFSSNATTQPRWHNSNTLGSSTVSLYDNKNGSDAGSPQFPTPSPFGFPQSTSFFPPTHMTPPNLPQYNPPSIPQYTLSNTSQLIASNTPQFPSSTIPQYTFSDPPQYYTPPVQSQSFTTASPFTMGNNYPHNNNTTTTPTPTPLPPPPQSRPQYPYTTALSTSMTNSKRGPDYHHPSPPPPSTFPFSTQAHPSKRSRFTEEEVEVVDLT